MQVKEYLDAAEELLEREGVTVEFYKGEAVPAREKVFAAILLSQEGELQRIRRYLDLILIVCVAGLFL